MSLNSTEPRSITAQLVWLFAPAAALLLFCGLGVLYWIVVRHALEEDNAVLIDKVSALRADLGHSAGPSILRAELRSVRGGEHAAYWIRVLDASGATVAETPGMSATLPSNSFPPARRERSRAVDLRTRGRLFSLVSAVEAVDGTPFTIQVAQDRSADERFAKKFRALLAAVMIAGVFASAAIAVTVAKRGLRPLAAMAGSLQRIGPKWLDRRVPVTGWPRELQPLATAFDELLDRLQDSFTRLSQFSADLAHELRTPIANIRGEAEVALTRPRTPEEYRDVLESSVAESQRLSGIIENLLFVARAEADENPIQPSLFEARKALEKIAAYYRTFAEERRITINCHGDGEVLADPILFGRAISNLLDNAMRFTPDGGAIEMRAAQTDRGTDVSVSDTGSGIAAEHLPRIFDRFYRVDASRSSEGTGLGLALVKSIAELHGGAVGVKSEVGRGTAMTLSLPRSV